MSEQPLSREQVDEALRELCGLVSAMEFSTDGAADSAAITAKQQELLAHDAALRASLDKMERENLELSKDKHTLMDANTYLRAEHERLRQFREHAIEYEKSVQSRLDYFGAANIEELGHQRNDLTAQLAERDAHILALAQEGLTAGDTIARLEANAETDRLLLATKDRRVRTLEEALKPVVAMLTDLEIIPVGCSREQELAWKKAVKDLRQVGG